MYYFVKLNDIKRSPTFCGVMDDFLKNPRVRITLEITEFLSRLNKTTSSRVGLAHSSYSNNSWEQFSNQAAKEEQNWRQRCEHAQSYWFTESRRATVSHRRILRHHGHTGRSSSTSTSTSASTTFTDARTHGHTDAWTHGRTHRMKRITLNRTDTASVSCIVQRT